METETAHEDIKLIDAIMRPQLEGTEEKDTFEVRPGITFSDYEIFLGESVEAIERRAFEKRKQRGTVPIFCNGVLYRLRNKRLTMPPIYHRKDVIREINACLRDIVTLNPNFKLSDPATYSDYCLENRKMVEYLQGLCRDRRKEEGFIDRPLKDFAFSSMVEKALSVHGISTLRQLCEKTVGELESMDGVGFSCVRRIRDELERLGLRLRENG